MPSAVLSMSCLQFLEQLKANNSREWFAANKQAFLAAQADVETVANELLSALNKHDIIDTASGKRSLYRIYRDVRFSKDKTPFSTYWGGRFKRAGKQRRGGYYYHFELGDKSFVLCGFWGPSPQDLKLIREDIAFDDGQLRAIITKKDFTNEFEKLKGDCLKTTPKGYTADHKAIDLLRYKQFLVMRRFTDEELLSADFCAKADAAFKKMRPFLNYMSDVLNSDANGLPL